MTELPNNFSHAVMFHHFYDEKHPKGQGAISGEEFEQILDWLSNYYLINDAHVYLEKVLNNNLHKTDICLSFDDALLCQYDRCGHTDSICFSPVGGDLRLCWIPFGSICRVDRLAPMGVSIWSNRSLF